MKFSFASSSRKKSESNVVPTINKDLFEDEPVSMCLCVDKTSGYRIIKNSQSKFNTVKPKVVTK